MPQPQTHPGVEALPLVAKDDDPRRVEPLTCIRVTCEPLKCSEAMVFVDALAIHLWPQVGYAWMPTGMYMTVMTGRTNEQHDLVGALDLATGALLHGVAARQTTSCAAICLPVLTLANWPSSIPGSLW
jgi:hypothetical protein